MAAFAGWLGPLVTCGADGAKVCVTWPGPVSATVWLVFVATIAGLVIWQARDWRGVALASWELRAVGAVLAIALVERTWRIDLAQVAYDESSAASLIAAWRYDGLFPLTGIVSSIGIPNPPGWPYLLAIVLLPFDSPYALVGLGVLTGLLAIGLTWWVGRRWIGVWGGLAAATFYAGGFWSTILGRGGWQPEFLQVPVLLCLDALLLLAIRRWPWALAIACGWLALMVQLHYVGALFAALVPLAAWPARRVLRPVHIAAAGATAVVLLVPFLIFELDPAVRLRDISLLAADAGVTARWDLDSWNLVWTLASNGGAAGLGGPDAAGLGRALGRWTQIGLLGIPLVGLGLLSAVAGWPRGWQGWLIATWMLMPVVGLARHTQGVLFHYLYLGLPGMALCVGALGEWSARRAGAALQLAVAAALAAYVAVSFATLWVELDHADQTLAYPGLGRPLKINMAAADAARQALPAGGQVLVGGYYFEAEVLRFSLGYGVPSQLFDDCGTSIPAAPKTVYLLNSEHTPAAAALTAVGAPLLARVARPDDAFLVFGAVTTPTVENGGADTPACRERWR